MKLEKMKIRDFATSLDLNVLMVIMTKTIGLKGLKALKMSQKEEKGVHSALI
jgi:hypothetical protein